MAQKNTNTPLIFLDFLTQGNFLFSRLREWIAGLTTTSMTIFGRPINGTTNGKT